MSLDIWSLKERCLSKITPRLRADRVGVIRELSNGSVGFTILASCLGKPNVRNSVFDGFNKRKFAAIQEETSVRPVCSDDKELWKHSGEVELKSCVSSA